MKSRIFVIILTVLTVASFLPLACKKAEQVVKEAEYTLVRPESKFTNETGAVFENPALYTKRGDTNAVYLKSLDGGSYIRLRHQ